MSKTPLILFVFAATSALAPGATVVLSDTTFANSDWSTTIITQAGPGPISQSATQVSSGGNPTSYRSQTISWGQVPSPSTSTITVASFGPLLYNPAVSGAILTMQIEYDLARISVPANFTSAGNYRPYLLQNGNMFVYALGANTLADSPGWTSHSRTSTSPSDWNPVTGFGSGTPDFSASGAPITFGYRVFGGVSCPSGFDFCFADSIVSGLDNFKITITTADTPSDVPEPSTSVMVSVSLLLTVCALRRKGSLLR